jgi:DNA polymerase III alpha subunit
LENEEEKLEKELAYKEYERFLNRDIYIAGMVVGTRNFETKNNKQKGELTIEDYSDSITLDFWNEDYLEYRRFFKPKIFVLVKLNVYRPYYFPNQVRIKVNEISLLNEVFEKHPKNLMLNIYPDLMTRDDYDEIYTALQKYNGTQNLLVNIIDKTDSNLNIQLPSKTGIKVTAELVSKLEQMKVRFRLK